MSFYDIMFTKEYGRGVYIKPDIYVEPGGVIMTCEIIKLTERDTVLLEDSALKLYKFKFNTTQDCIVLGDGSLINHSDTPNVRYDLEFVDGRFLMVFKAIRKIEPGEQVFSDYTQDDKSINIQEYLAV